MFTVGAPITIGAPQPLMSPMRAAGRLPIITVILPFAIGFGGCGPAGGGIAQATWSPTQAAGCPEIKTFGHPGPTITPGCPIGSKTRAAKGMSIPLVDVDHSTRDVHHGAC